MPAVIGIDLGTSSLQGVLVNEAGRQMASSKRTYPLSNPQPGWSEQEPLHWWAAFCAVVRELIAEADGQEIVGLGLAGQMHGLVALDAGREVVRPAILWNDQRTVKEVGQITGAVGASNLISRTGNPAVTGFQLPKLLWLRDSEPASFERLDMALLPKDWLGFMLTGETVTEPSDATGTGCFNIHSGDWDDSILGAVGLSRSLFPEVLPSVALRGTVSAEASLATGLPEGLPVVAGAGDNAAANIGLGIDNARPERGSLSLGTSGVLFTPLGSPAPDSQGRIHLFAHADGNWCLLGVTLAAGGSIEWFVNRFLERGGVARMNELAASSPPGSRGVSWHPYLSGERSPWLRPDLRASFSGLSLSNDLADMSRAVFEGVAFSLRDVLEVQSGISPVGELLVTGGGAASPLWLQIMADALGVILTVTADSPGAAYGSALLALEGVTGAGKAARLARPAVTGLVHPQVNPCLEDAWQRFRTNRPGSQA